MGFNNEGVDAAAQRLRSRGNHLVGGNIGKNKTTANEKAIEDYLTGFDQLFDHVDYFTVNVSSPNTPRLRELQGREPLTRLLEALQERNRSKTISKPVLLKIAPDLEEDALHEIVEVIRDAELDGVLATNTTIGRSGLSVSSEEIERIGAGGLSGDPVRRRSTEVVGFLRSQLGQKAVIIGVGGVRNGRDAIEKIVAGANLVQVYTGFVYEGPAMVKRMLSEMHHGLKSGHWIWPHRRI
jgi:dihydroorotate dehydrogenase